MNNLHILYSRPSLVTGRNLVTVLSERLKDDGWSVSGGRRGNPPPDTEVLFRWGSSMMADIDDQVPRVINKATQVAHVSNRRHMLTALSSHSYPPSRTDEGYGMVLREAYGRYGRDIRYFQSDEPLPLCEQYVQFYVAYWPAPHEVRVHIVGGKSVLMQYKKYTGPDDEPQWDDRSMFPIIRNRDNGWTLHPLSTDLAHELGINKAALRNDAKLVMQGLRLSTGAVDYLVRPANTTTRSASSFRILEVNTAPGLEASSMDRYVRGIRNLVLTGTTADEDD